LLLYRWFQWCKTWNLKFLLKTDISLQIYLQLTPLNVGTFSPSLSYVPDFWLPLNVQLYKAVSNVKRCCMVVCHPVFKQLNGTLTKSDGTSPCSLERATSPCPKPHESSTWTGCRGLLQGLQHVEGPTLSRQSVHRWWWSCQPYAPTLHFPHISVLVLISVRGWVKPWAIMWLEGLGKLKNKSMTSSGLEIATFRLVV
jgi:hypothetical protein